VIESMCGSVRYPDLTSSLHLTSHIVILKLVGGGPTKTVQRGGGSVRLEKIRMFEQTVETGQLETIISANVAWRAWWKYEMFS